MTARDGGITACALPANALLEAYRATGYADCYTTSIGRDVSHAEYVEAFYTTLPFRLERLILKLGVARPSTDAGVRALANGTADAFAAWHVEARAPGQLLLCDFQRRTRSWLMVASEGSVSAPETRLYFGSAVVPPRRAAAGPSSMGLVFGSLLGFHKLYSRILLRAARRRLAAQPDRSPPR